MDTEKRSPVTAIIVGCGHRSLFYGQYALEHPEDMKIVGVADPDPVRRKIAKDRFSLPDSMLFGSSEELCARPRLADAIINGTESPVSGEEALRSVHLIRSIYRSAESRDAVPF